MKMRWWIAIIFCVVLVPAVRAQDEAEKLYAAMEQKLTKAKAYKFDFTFDAPNELGPVRVKGTWILAMGNKLKISYEGEARRKPVKLSMSAVADGKEIVLRRDFGQKTKTEIKTPDKLNDRLTGWLNRMGVHAVGNTDDPLFQLVTFKKLPEVDSKFKASDFKLLDPEKIGDRQAKVVEYKLEFDADAPKLTCKVWLDTQTNLPLKREIASRYLVREIYSGWELDPKLPEDMFALPK
jgi:outer membrane lipoprotein-sorting protein